MFNKLAMIEKVKRRAKVMGKVFHKPTAQEILDEV